MNLTTKTILVMTNSHFLKTLNSCLDVANRTLDCTVALLEKLEKDPGQSIEQIVEESYNATLKPWHGWISSAAYKVKY